MIRGILVGTPVWVYFTFAYVVLIGIANLRPRPYSRSRQVIYPILFVVNLVIDYFSISRTWHQVYIDYLFLLCGAGIGFVLTFSGLLYRSETPAQEIHIGRSWFVLVTLVPYFLFRYFLGFLEATEPVRFAALDPDRLVSTTSHLLSGLFLGRFLKIVWRRASMLALELVR